MNDTKIDWRVGMTEDLINIRENQIECELDQN